MFCSPPLVAQILPLVLEATADPDKHARESACFALGQIGEHCQPEIMRYQADILPVVFQVLGDERQSVQGIACYVLETFSDHLASPCVPTGGRQEPAAAVAVPASEHP